MIRPSNQLPHSVDMGFGETSLDLAARAAANNGPAAPQKQNALKALHRLLRGRYHWVVILSVLLGGGGAWLGYRHGLQTYGSIGTIKINYTLRTMVVRTEDQQLPNYDAFVNDQMAVLTSWNLLSSAIQQQEWTTVRPQAVEGNLVLLAARVKDLNSRIKITRKDDQLLVEGRDTNPQVAVSAVHSVIDTYESTYLREPAERDPIVRALRPQQAELTVKASKIRANIVAIAGKYGIEHLEGHYVAKLGQVTRNETAVQDMENAIALATVNLDNLPEEGQSPLAGVSDESLTLLIPELQKLSEDLVNANLTLEKLKHISASASARASAEATIKSIQSQIDGRIRNIRKTAAAGINLPNLPTIHSKRDLEALKAQIEVLKRAGEKLGQQLLEIGKDNGELIRLHGEEDRNNAELDAVTKRIEQLIRDDPMNRRVEIVGRGEWPIAPDRDTRPKWAAMGGFGGTMLGTLSVILIGFLSARLRAPRDLSVHVDASPVLGLIPQLEDGPDYAKRAAIAAECVHRTRTMLEIWGRGNQRMVIGVTSPSHGSGNTSVAMSLGVSFATAGLKTLLIDCDFVTNGLTPRLQTVVKRDLAKVLKRTGRVTELEMSQATRLMKEQADESVPPETALGNACVKLGFITQEELEAAKAMQARDPVGILDALSGEPLMSCVGKTGIRNLSILPRGNVTPAHAAKLGSQAMRQVLDAARQQFDTVIIDTSAILTSLESSIVASSVDGMVVTVARGERRAHLEKAIKRLNTLECPVAGIIFNQVLPSDMPQEPQLSRVSTANTNAPSDADIFGANLELVGRLSTLGPLASSMVTRFEMTEESSLVA